MSTSLTTGIVAAESHAQLEKSSSLSLAAAPGPYRQQLASRQPPATAAAETAAVVKVVMCSRGGGLSPPP